MMDYYKEAREFLKMQVEENRCCLDELVILLKRAGIEQSSKGTVIATPQDVCQCGHVKAFHAWIQQEQHRIEIASVVCASARITKSAPRPCRVMRRSTR